MSDNDEIIKKRMEAGRVFTPAAPVNEQALFAGRVEKLQTVVDTLMQRGRHVIVYGERGVGKTSLANIVRGVFSRANTIAPHVVCDSSDTFSSVWRKVFSSIHVLQQQPTPVGFESKPPVPAKVPILDLLPDVISPDDVRRALESLSSQALVVLVIIDEFDRISASRDRRLFADTIKILSDLGVSAMLMLVGVADTVEELIAEHQSVERALVQVQMPRMSTQELSEILERGFSRLGMRIEPDAADQVCFLSVGLPHFTHLLGLNSATAAILAGEEVCNTGHVDRAVEKAIQDAQQSVRKDYVRAVSSPKKASLYPDVLLACALAESDDLGYFQAAGVRDPLRKITGRTLDIPSFARHIKEFCEASRASVLQKTGAKHRFRFRFRSPLMSAYVVLQGISSARISHEFARERSKNDRVVRQEE